MRLWSSGFPAGQFRNSAVNAALTVEEGKEGLDVHEEGRRHHSWTLTVIRLYSPWTKLSVRAGARPSNLKWPKNCQNQPLM